MARAFATNQQINGTTTVAKNLTNFSMAGWFRRGSSGSGQIFGMIESNLHRTDVNHWTDNGVYYVVSNGNLAYGVVNKNINGWNHIAFSFDGSQSGNSNRLKGYFNGDPQTLNFAGTTIPATTSNNSLIETFRINRHQAANLWGTGDYAELGMWQATLTAEEVASLAKGMTCDKIRPQSLVYYTPLIRDIQDLARGMTLTNTNSTVANHPRVYA
jgi:hypothetical protein